MGSIFSDDLVHIAHILLENFMQTMVFENTLLDHIFQLL